MSIFSYYQVNNIIDPLLDSCAMLHIEHAASHVFVLF